MGEADSVSISLGMSSNPSLSAKAPRMYPNPRRSKFGTFSNSYGVRPISREMRKASRKRPVRSPSAPFPVAFATKASWHGNPAVMRSICPTSYFDKSGQFVLKTVWQRTSYSHRAAVLNPAYLRPSAMPPIPASRSSVFIYNTSNACRVSVPLVQRHMREETMLLI